MAVAGSLTYETKIDKKGFEKGLSSLEKEINSAGTKVKNIVTALGIDKLITATFDIINNSIDGAISRLDTLNGYPSVMSNLGISTEKAQSSISKMSDKLSGLPTTLDEGAQAVQRFTSANNDIEKSTDYFLAFNNALLAGGASAEIQSNALEQLSQMYAVGTVDAQAWRSVLTAMPAQLQQVAKYMGYASTAVEGDLYTALKKGEVSMEDFMQSMVKLNTEGANGFLSFEEQAKNTTGGIATSITVAKTQVVKGVADIINKIDELLEENGLGGIGEVISNIGKKAKETLDLAAEKLPEIIKLIKEIVPLIIAAVAALITYKSILVIISAINFASKIVGTTTAFITLIPAIKSVKDAMLLLNMVIAANPIILIIAAIVGLVAAFIYLWNTSEKFRNFWIELWETIKNALKTAWNAVEKFFTETIPNAFQKLKDKLSEIGNSIAEFFKNIWNNIVNFFTETIPQWIENVIEWFSNLPYMIGYLIGQIIGNIIKFGINLWNWVTNDLPKIINSIVECFKQLPGKIWTWLINTINSIIEWGKNVYITAKEWVSKTINSIVECFKQLPGRIWTWLINTISKIINWGVDIAKKGKEAAIKLYNSIIDTIKELPNKVLNIGKNIVEGLWNGIVGAKKWITNKVKEFANGILDGMKDALGIHSPSTLFRDEVGKYIPQGIGIGIEADTESALKAIDDMNNEIISEMNRTVAFETGSINAKASVKSNNSMLNIIQASFSIDGSVDIDGQKAGRIMTPYMTKILQTGGAY